MEQLRVHHGSQEVERPLSSGEDDEQRRLLVPDHVQVYVVRVREVLHILKVKCFQPYHYGDQDALQRLGRAGLELLVILHGKAFRIQCLYLFKDIVQRRFLGIELIDLRLPQQPHDIGEVLALFLRIVEQVGYDGDQEKLFAVLPERLARFCFRRGRIADQRRHERHHILVAVDVAERVVVVPPLHVREIEALYLVATALKELSVAL